jgi:hypothetical protein
VEGKIGAAWAPGVTPRAVFRFEIAGGRVVALEVIADGDRLAEIAPVVLG